MCTRWPCTMNLYCNLRTTLALRHYAYSACRTHSWQGAESGSGRQRGALHPVRRPQDQTKRVYECASVRPIVFIVVPFWGYPLGSLTSINQKRTTMEATGKVGFFAYQNKEVPPLELQRLRCFLQAAQQHAQKGPTCTIVGDTSLNHSSTS